MKVLESSENSFHIQSVIKKVCKKCTISTLYKVVKQRFWKNKCNKQKTKQSIIVIKYTNKQHLFRNLNIQRDSTEIYLHLESGIESVGDQTSKALSARSSGFLWDSGWSSGSVAWKSLPTLILILSTETAMDCWSFSLLLHFFTKWR